jgi:hypothetical protein
LSLAENLLTAGLSINRARGRVWSEGLCFACLERLASLANTWRGVSGTLHQLLNLAGQLLLVGQLSGGGARGARGAGDRRDKSRLAAAGDVGQLVGEQPDCGGGVLDIARRQRHTVAYGHRIGTV